MTDIPPGRAGDADMHDVRAWLAEINGEQYAAYRSVHDARRDPGAAIVLSGDYGGTIFVTVPVRRLGCGVSELWILVSDLDAVTWMSGDLTIATVSVETHPVGSGVAGGDGGGAVIEGVWIHPVGVPDELRPLIVEVIAGGRSRIDTAVLRRLRQRELDRKKLWRTRNLARLDWDFDIHPPAIPLD